MKLMKAFVVCVGSLGLFGCSLMNFKEPAPEDIEPLKGLERRPGMAYAHLRVGSFVDTVRGSAVRVYTLPNRIDGICTTQTDALQSTYPHCGHVNGGKVLVDLATFEISCSRTPFCGELRLHHGMVAPEYIRHRIFQSDLSAIQRAQIVEMIWASGEPSRKSQREYAAQARPEQERILAEQRRARDEQLAASRRIFEEKMSRRRVAFAAAKSQPLRVGSPVCSRDNRYAFVEGVSGDRVQLAPRTVKGSGIFGELSLFDSSVKTFEFDERFELRWEPALNWAHCSYEIS